MAKSRGGDEQSKRPKASAAILDGAVTGAATAPPTDATAAKGPTRRQVRQIARLVDRLETAGEFEVRRRRQLQVALERGRKTKRHRQQVDRAAARVGELIVRLRTLARELESPVPEAAVATPTVVAATTRPAKVTAATTTAATTKAATTKPVARRSRSKPTSA